MSTITVERLKSLLRGELSATETYEQALAKFADTPAAFQLHRIHDDHVEAANVLKAHIQMHGGKPDDSSGAWGTFAKMAEGTAKLFGADAALKVLKEGEEHGIKEYEEALDDDSLGSDCTNLITSTLLPKTRDHIPALEALIAGLVERVTAEQAYQHLRSDPEALLVCAYADEEKCETYKLEGAISLHQFQQRKEHIPPNSELIFYCA